MLVELKPSKGSAELLGICRFILKFLVGLRAHWIAQHLTVFEKFLLCRRSRDRRIHFTCWSTWKRWSFCIKIGSAVRVFWFFRGAGNTTDCKFRWRFLCKDLRHMVMKRSWQFDFVCTWMIRHNPYRTRCNVLHWRCAFDERSFYIVISWRWVFIPRERYSLGNSQNVGPWFLCNKRTLAVWINKSDSLMLRIDLPTKSRWLGYTKSCFADGSVGTSVGYLRMLCVCN